MTQTSNSENEPLLIWEREILGLEVTQEHVNQEWARNNPNTAVAAYFRGCI
jgi:hypothetical protein